MATNYHVYGPTAVNGPIDYGTILATVSALTWPTPPLTAGTWRFGVRAFDTVSGLEEANVDAVAEIVIDASLADVTATPRPPTALSAVATANGTAHVAWTYPRNSGVAPAGFRVYVGTPTPDYLAVAANVPATGGTQYSVNLAGLTDGVAYQVGVRAYSAAGLEEANVVTAAIVADSSPPANVQNLTAS
jgi:hypothetical protein